MKDAVLFDLGNTLIRYYQRSEFPGILEEAIAGVQVELEAQGLLQVPTEGVWARVQAEDYESKDHRVRPLEGRLARIFQLGEVEPAFMEVLCRRFLTPLLSRAQCYPEALPVLQTLRGQGIRTAIVSNTPWGSPAAPWRDEIERWGLGAWVDVTVFCRDAGWRKPALPIFALALERLATDASRCLFVGDDPRWDLAGARAVGMEALLVQREGGATHGEAGPVADLSGVLRWMAI